MPTYGYRYGQSVLGTQRTSAIHNFGQLLFSLYCNNCGKAALDRTSKWKRREVSEGVHKVYIHQQKVEDDTKEHLQMRRERKSIEPHM